MQHFHVAPWPKSLWVSSTLGTILLGAVGVGAVRAIPPSGFAHTFGTGMACLLPVIAVLSAFFVVTGYTVTPHELRIQRLLWSTPVRLEGLRQAWHDPKVICGSTRVFGNGGLYSFTGLYHSQSLGRYRLFGTDLSRSVVLVLSDRTVVVTPASPHALLVCLQRVFPGIHPHMEARDA
jgi:hypothetical protein